MSEILLPEEITHLRFDHCFIALGPVENDSRTLNIIRTLLKSGKKICFIGLGTEQTKHVLTDYDITIIPVFRYDKRRFLTLWWDFHRSIFQLKSKIHAQTFWAMDLYVLPLASWFSGKHHAALIYDSREVYTALGTIHDEPFKQQVVSLVERYFIRKATRVFTSGDLDSDYLKEHYHIKRPEILLNVPPFNDPEESDILRSYFNIGNEKTILLYQGLIGKGRGIIRIVETLPYLPDVVFCIIGAGEAYTQKIWSKCDDLDVRDRVFIRGWVPYDELIQWTSSADIGVAFIEPVSLSYQFALPNKLFEYAMAGIPSIVSDLPAMRPILQKYNIGRLVEPTIESRRLAGAIESLFNKKADSFFKEECIKAKKEYNWENQEPKILELAGTSAS